MKLEVVQYAIEMERNIPARITFLLAIYLGLGLLSTWFATKRGYKVTSGLLFSYLITPLVATVVFAFKPKSKK
jgi:hypothetical protein